MGVLCCALGILIFGIGLIITFSDVRGGAAKTLVPALGVVSFVFGTNLIINAPPESPPTLYQTYKEIYDSCMYNRVNGDVALKLKLTKEELCARSAQGVIDIQPKVEETVNEKVLLPVPAKEPNS